MVSLYFNEQAWFPHFSKGQKRIRFCFNSCTPSAVSGRFNLNLLWAISTKNQWMTKHSGFCVWMVEVCTKHGRKKLWFESLFLFVCYFIQGIRGLMSAQILRRISEKFPTFLDSIDMFAGTSTGSIISSLLAVQTPLDEVVNIYQTHAKEIFQNPSSVGQIFGGM